MKQFARHRTHDEIVALCKKHKVPLDDSLYLQRGWDTILVGTKDLGYVIYNTWNGKFFGTTDKGTPFDSCSTRHDRTEWMQKLLHFFYVEK